MHGNGLPHSVHKTELSRILEIRLEKMRAFLFAGFFGGRGLVFAPVFEGIG